MEHIGILGSGRVATTLATGLTNGGHDVSIGSRDPETSAARWQGPPVRFTDPAQAARDSFIVINATPGQSSLDRLVALREELDGKILIDVSNATAHDPSGLPGALVYPNGSLAEHLQNALPGTRVVKTLNTMLFTVIAAPGDLSVPPTAFLSGNDGEAKLTVTGLLKDLGWQPDWIQDLGDVTTARGTEALALLVPSVIRSQGFAPFAVTIAR